MQHARTDGRLVELEAALATQKERADALEKERDVLRASRDGLLEELKLLKLRLFVAKAERVDTQQLALEFQHKLRQVEELAGTLDMPLDGSDEDESGASKKMHLDWATKS